MNIILVIVSVLMLGQSTYAVSTGVFSVFIGNELFLQFVVKKMYLENSKCVEVVTL